MKRKTCITLIAHINARDEAGVTSSYPVSATFNTEIDWLPLYPGYVVTGIVPNGFDEILLEDKESGRLVRHYGLRKYLPAGTTKESLERRATWCSGT